MSTVASEVLYFNVIMDQQHTNVKQMQVRILATILEYMGIGICTSKHYRMLLSLYKLTFEE